MGDLDELIEIDSDNIPNSRKALTAFDPELSAALDTAAGMFKTFSRCMEGKLDNSEDLAVLAGCAEELGIDAAALIALIKSENRGQVLDRARAAWFSGFASKVRAIIFLLLHRHFMWGTTDLLRMRRTAAIGYARLEAESLALLCLMRDDPAIANRWLHVATDEEGRRFHRDLQPRILEELRRLNLIRAYEAGSGRSLHVRLWSAVEGLSLDRMPDGVWLTFQEGWEQDQLSYFGDILFFVHTQERVFRALGEAFPEVSDSIWSERVKIFSRTVDYLWDRFKKAFPDQQRRLGGFQHESASPPR